MITRRKKRVTVRSLWLLSALAMMPLAGSARADGGGGASAGVTVTAKIVSCRPTVTMRDYVVTVRPSDGRAEEMENSGTTYFPAEVATIDITNCDDAVDVTGDTDGQGNNPGVFLKDIGASISINKASGHSGGWDQSYGDKRMVMTIPAGNTQTLYAGINPMTAHTAYITGKQEGSITLTLTPH